MGSFLGVAPVRERGLKCADLTYQQGVNKSRSREGAWIEIYSSYSTPISFASLPRGSVD